MSKPKSIRNRKRRKEEPQPEEQKRGFYEKPPVPDELAFKTCIYWQQEWLPIQMSADDFIMERDDFGRLVVTDATIRWPAEIRPSPQKSGNATLRKMDNTEIEIKDIIEDGISSTKVLLTLRIKSNDGIWSERFLQKRLFDEVYSYFPDELMKFMLVRVGLDSLEPVTQEDINILVGADPNAPPDARFDLRRAIEEEKENPCDCDPISDDIMALLNSLGSDADTYGKIEDGIDGAFNEAEAEYMFEAKESKPMSTTVGHDDIMNMIPNKDDGRAVCETMNLNNMLVEYANVTEEDMASESDENEKSNWQPKDWYNAADMMTECDAEVDAHEAKKPLQDLLNQYGPGLNVYDYATANAQNFENYAEMKGDDALDDEELIYLSR